MEGVGRALLLTVSLGLLAIASAWKSIEKSAPEINHRLKSKTDDLKADSSVEGECDETAALLLIQAVIRF